MWVLRFQGVVQYQDSPKIIASILNILVSTRVNIVCFSCSRLRLIPVLACESQILNRQWRLSAKNKGRRDWRPLFLSLYFMQSLAKLIRTGRNTISTSYTFQFGNGLFYSHAFNQSADSLKISIASSPEEHLLDDSIFHFQFDVTATSTLRLIGQFHLILQLASC